RCISASRRRDCPGHTSPTPTIDSSRPAISTALARTFLQTEVREYVGHEREVVVVLHQPAIFIEDVDLRHLDQLHRTLWRLARRDVAYDARTGVVFKRDAMRNQFVKSIVVRHGVSLYIISSWRPRSCFCGMARAKGISRTVSAATRTRRSPSSGANRLKR